MLENLRERKYNQIDRRTEREKREVDYISKIAEEYRSQIIGFLEDFEGISRDEKIFNKTKEIIGDVESHCRPMGMVFYNNVDNLPGVQLGWLNPYDPDGFKCTLVRISEKGYEIVDGLREIQGRLPIREHVKKVRENLFGKDD